MNSTNNTPVLASFATLKSLNDSKKYVNSYQLLAEFISYIIDNQNLHTFTAVEMKNKLNNIFGFDVPEAIVKKASKKIAAVTREQDFYSVNSQKVVSDSLIGDTIKTAESENSNIINALFEYIKSKEPKKKFSLDSLTQNFIAFLIEDQGNSSSEYTNLISEFVLKNENNVPLQNSLKAIKEGSILYIGLCYNINEIGSLTQPLTLFLATEVLFGLVGFNGEIYKQLAQDLFSQVKSANSKSVKIELRYFKDVKQEIDRFFGEAESIVEENKKFNNTVAMKTIVNSCKTQADVLIKQTDFYYSLQYGFGILEDDKDNYYEKENEIYNLESMSNTGTQTQESWKFIDHINKLREGKVFRSNIDAKYLIVTNSRSVLYASREQSEKNKNEEKLDYVNDYAVSVDKMTNILWYKLGKGFGKKSYPSNVDMALKAKIVLSATVAHNVSEIYASTKEQRRKGEITDEQLAARIISLHKKPILPEDFNGDSLDDIMDFSPEYLSRYEEEVNLNKEALREKELQIQAIKQEVGQQLKERDEELAKKDEQIKKLAVYQEKEEEKNKRKGRRKRIIKFILSQVLKISVILIFACLAAFVSERQRVMSFIIAAVDIIGVIFLFRDTITKDISKYFPKET